MRDQLVLDDLYRYAVLSENGKVFYGYPEETIRLILAHRQSKGRLVYHRNAEGEVDGMVMWHRFSPGWDLEDVQNWREDDEQGSEIYIAGTIADSPQVRRWGILKMIEKEPDVIWCRKWAAREKGGRIESREISNRALARLMKQNG